MKVDYEYDDNLNLSNTIWNQRNPHSTNALYEHTHAHT